ncbi:hypothetical protein B0T16DRAFT_462307 [Cercophora newfieldiana]|uniref:Heterokaryon incompatibility domain-containing protein n=1 Tax=Cercophora newfieldiana TaxID=92897 RepID=A0AA39XQV0_9PEZI|nr:hypothetical protein B0T16DRAFT_462307 [Cercophora newfieldiana]
MAWVGQLDERCLRADSLCIVQDDAEAKDRDIHWVDIVSMMAYATIAAAHGRNADVGLPGLRPGRGERKEEQRRMEMVAISRLAAADRERIRGPYRVEGRLRCSDRRYYENDWVDGGVVSCLVVEWYKEVAARVTVTQVCWRAWRDVRLI